MAYFLLIFFLVKTQLENYSQINSGHLWSHHYWQKISK